MRTEWFLFDFIFFSVTTERRDPGERQNRSLVHNVSAALGDDDSPPCFFQHFLPHVRFTSRHGTTEENKVIFQTHNFGSLFIVSFYLPMDFCFVFRIIEFSHQIQLSIDLIFSLVRHYIFIPSPIWYSSAFLSISLPVLIEVLIFWKGVVVKCIAIRFRDVRYYSSAAKL